MNDAVKHRVSLLVGLVILSCWMEAHSTPLMQVLGAGNRTIDMADSSTANIEVDFAVTVQPLKDRSRVVTELIGLGRGDRELEFEPTWLSFGMHATRKDRGTISIKLPAEQLKRAGNYAFTVEFWKRTQPDPDEAGAQPSPPVDSDGGSLTLTLIRPAGGLTLQGPVKIERVVYIPYRWSKLFPSSVLLSETSGRNFVQIDAPNSDRRSRVQLRSSANSQTVAELIVSLPEHVGAAQQIPAGLELSDDTSIGSLSGTLEIMSDQLDARPFSTAIEVVTRAHRFWLVVLIVAGVLVGFVVRVVLEERKQRKTAEAAARRARDEFKAAAEKVKDDKYKPVLDDALRDLSNVIARKRAEAAALVEASDAALSKLTETLSDLEADRDALDQKISTAESDLGRPEDYVFAAEGIIEANSFLTCARGAMEQGHITSRLESFDAELSEHLRSIVSALRERTDALANEVRSAADWAELDVSQVIDDLGEEITGIATGLASLEQTGDIGTRMRKLNFVLRRFAQRYVNERAPVVLAYVSGLFEELQALPPCRSLQAVISLGELIEQLAGAEENSLEVALEDMLKQERWLLAALEAALDEASDATQTDISQVQSGNYRQAAELIVNKVGSKVLGPLPTPPPKDITPVAQDERRWIVSVVTNTVPRGGTPVMLSGRIDLGDTDVPLFALSSAWRVNGMLQPSTGPGGLNCLYTPALDETELNIEIVVSSGPPTNISAGTSTTLHVRPSHDREIATELEAEAATIDGIQTALAGAVIVFAGYAIFQASFVGSFVDISSALFWGFGIDISVAKALEYSAPLKSKALPT